MDMITKENPALQGGARKYPYHQSNKIDNIPQAFHDAMTAAGIGYKGAIKADGDLHRFRVEGDKNGTLNGWYVLHVDGIPSGAYGSWKHQISGTWSAKAQADLTPAERAEHKRRMDAARKAKEAEEQAIRQAAREKAAAIWSASLPAPDDHSYLARKGVKAHGLRLSRGALVLPMRDSSGVIHSLQFIDAEGNKRFLSGGRKKGCYFAIGTPTGTLCIAEGFATAASVYESTGHAVAVAFDAGNLLPVAQALRQKFPEAEIILAADNDTETPGNPGLTRAREAAAAIGGLIAIAE